MGEFAIKVSPFGGELWKGRIRLAEGEVQTTTCSRYKPIVKWMQTTTRS